MRFIALVFLWVGLAGCLFSTKALAQDKITLLNGNELSGKIIDTTFMEVSYQSKAGGKTNKIERYRIFSINWDNTESVLYRQDTVLGNFYNEHQMRMFVCGEQDAIKKFKTPLTFPGGLVAGFLGGFVQPIVLSRMAENSPKSGSYNLLAKPFFTPIIPVTYCFVIGTKWIKIKKQHVANPLYLSEDTYIEGFDRAARSHRIQQALWGGVVGLVAGLATTAIIYK